MSPYPPKDPHAQGNEKTLKRYIVSRISNCSPHIPPHPPPRLKETCKSQKAAPLFFLILRMFPTLPSLSEGPCAGLRKFRLLPQGVKAPLERFRFSCIGRCQRLQNGGSWAGLGEATAKGEKNNWKVGRPPPT